MVGPFHVQGAAESDASVHLWVRSHVPGTRRDRAQAEEAGGKKAKPDGTMEGWNTGILECWVARGIPSPSFHRSTIPTEGIRLWAVFQRGSAHDPPPENVGSERDVVGMLDRRRVRA